MMRPSRRRKRAPRVRMGVVMMNTRGDTSKNMNIDCTVSMRSFKNMTMACTEWRLSLMLDRKSFSTGISDERMLCTATAWSCRLCSRAELSFASFSCRVDMCDSPFSVSFCALFISSCDSTALFISSSSWEEARRRSLIIAADSSLACLSSTSVSACPSLIWSDTPFIVDTPSITSLCPSLMWRRVVFTLADVSSMSDCICVEFFIIADSSSFRLRHSSQFLL
mmetsp:Transcript_805/g.1467  ORF Transcript_805/g.1467 Transcript_805/m.1467 type:complete len:223 (+) Transcript_805:1094-1762(+)